MQPVHDFVPDLAPHATPNRVQSLAIMQVLGTGRRLDEAWHNHQTVETEGLRNLYQGFNWHRPGKHQVPE